jgi:peptidoglycan/LPS O-acetylase OafA/YrhL
MQPKPRLIGLDLVRGIAAYAVVLFHSRVDPAAPVSDWAAKLLILGSFAVPFFLATSFYLTINKFSEKQVKVSLKSRFLRLLIPYAFWSLLYLAVRLIKYLITHETDKITSLFSDPLALFFLGSAAVQLYFLPLLFSGTCLVKIAEYLLENRIHLRTMILLLTLSLLFYELLLASGNGFQIGNNLAFQTFWASLLPGTQQNPVIRLVSVLLAWWIKCLPYILMSMILSHPRVKATLSKVNPQWFLIICGGLFIGLTFSQTLVPSFPKSLRELGIAYTSLMFALILSKSLKENRIIENVGLCTFGIYLIHHLILEISYMVIGKIYPQAVAEVSALNLLIFSIISFFISWAVTAQLKEKRFFSQLIF